MVARRQAITRPARAQTERWEKEKEEEELEGGEGLGLGVGVDIFVCWFKNKVGSVGWSLRRGGEGRIYVGVGVGPAWSLVVITVCAVGRICCLK